MVLGKKVALDLTTIKRSPLFKILQAQFLATLFLSACCLIFDVLVRDSAAAVSALVAGGVCLLPGLYVLAVSTRQVRDGDSGFGLALRAEAGRFLLSGAGFALVFVFVSPLNIVVFFGVLIFLFGLNAYIPAREAQRLRRRQ